ncbi:MAG: sulfatase family protein [Paludibacteraceae bacterium]
MRSSKLISAGMALLPLGFIAAQNTKPNVIIILADDIGYGDIEWLRNLETVNTPNVKKLADESLRFSNAHATSATSTPSRYGLLTGMYPWRKAGTGIAAGDAAMIIKPEQYTMADMFQSAGYTTAAIGKWHLGLGNKTGKQNWNGLITPNLSDLGFNYSFIMAATADRVPCVFIENGKAVNLDPADPIQVSYTKNFEGEPTGKDNPELLRLHPSNGHAMTIVDGISRIGFMKGGHTARWHDEDIADNITDKAVQFIENNKDKPFFLYFGTNDIHVPRMPNDRFKGKSGMGLRGDAILSFDYCVGRVMHTLDSLNISDNTLIILTSDNGPVVDDGYKDQAAELLGNHKPSDKFRGGKYSAFEAGTRVPFLVHWKDNIKKTGVINQLFSQADLFASLAEIIGGKIEPDAAPDSRDYSKLLTGKCNKGRKYLIEQNQSNKLTVVDKNGWKYIESSHLEPYDKYTNIELGNSPQDQLYDLKIDSDEKNNLSSRQPKILKKLKTILESEKSKGYLIN